MKRHILAATICLSMLIVVFTPAAGCKNPTAQSTSVKTLYSLGTVVNEAYAAYLSEVVSGRVTTNSVPSVSEKYTVFQNLFTSAIEFVSFNTNAAPPETVLRAATDFTSAVATAKGK